MKEKNKIYMLISILLLVISTTCIIKFSSQNLSVETSIALIFLIISIAMLNHWASISYIWTCEVCGEIRHLSIKENFLYLNIGIKKKYFHCNECGVKRIFNANYKY